MKVTKKILLTMLVFASAENKCGADQIDVGQSVNSPVNQSKSNKNVTDILIKQAFAAVCPAGCLVGSSAEAFKSACEVFLKFKKERSANQILQQNGKFFETEAAYLQALGDEASEKFPYLACLFYLEANKKDASVDLNEQFREFGISGMSGILANINVSGGFIANPKDLFIKKDKAGKSPMEQANELYKITSHGFKSRADFMEAVYLHQKSIVGGRPEVVQVFSDHFVNAK